MENKMKLNKSEGIKDSDMDVLPDMTGTPVSTTNQSTNTQKKNDVPPASRKLFQNKAANIGLIIVAVIFVALVIFALV